jgi:hypothetical protein
MKILLALQKNKSFWSLLSICLLFFCLRLPSLIEPDWYTDEGIYQVVGQAMDKGRLLYVQIWDNKPPLLYLLYALMHGDLFWVKTASLLFGIGTLIGFYMLCRKLLLHSLKSLICTGVFALLFGLPILEGDIANAENFILLPVVAAALLVVWNLPNVHKRQGGKAGTRIRYMGAGMLLGTALLIKTVAIFDFTAFFLFLLFIHLPKKLSADSIRKLPGAVPVQTCFLPLLFGFAGPVIICAIYFTGVHAFTAFFQSVFLGNVSYVTSQNTSPFPGRLLLGKLLVLFGLLAVLFKKRRMLDPVFLFITLWAALSLFSAFFSQRPYIHYLLVFLPSACLLGGFAFAGKSKKLSIIIGIIALIIIPLICYKFDFSTSNLTYQYAYYQNALSFLTGKKDTQDYQSFFDSNTPRDYAVADFLSVHLKRRDQIFIWGDRPQIYSLSHTLPPGEFTVAYHMTLSDNNMQETQQTLNVTKPKYIITLEQAPAFPFVLYTYSLTAMLTGADIYERNY